MPSARDRGASGETIATEDGRAILSRHDLFRNLSSADLDSVIRLSRVKAYQAREVIFHKGSEGRGLLAVLQGRVQIRAPGSDGREIILNLVAEGEVFGEMALLDGRERSADAVAMTRCRLLEIDRREFLPYLARNPQTALRMMAMLCDRLRRTTEQVEDLMFLSLPARLAKLLLADSWKGADAPGAPGREIELPQRTLANLIGFSRESVNKQLAEWQREGIIELAGGRIRIVDPAALARQGPDGPHLSRGQPGASRP